MIRGEVNELKTQIQSFKNSERNTDVSMVDLSGLVPTIMLSIWEKYREVTREQHAKGGVSARGGTAPSKPKHESLSRFDKVLALEKPAFNFSTITDLSYPLR